jgi:alkylhydroperoxidase family enzyme
VIAEALMKKRHVVKCALCALLVIGVGVVRGDTQPLTKARVLPLEPSEWTETHRQIIGPSAQTIDVFKTCLRDVELCRTWMPFTRYLLNSSLPAHDRELVILRTAWLCRTDYEWGHHVVGAKRAGLTDDEISRIAQSGYQRWSEFDALLLRAADELVKDQFITDRTWTGLAKKYTETQMIDLTFTVGQYTMLSMFLKSAAVQLEQGVVKLPK